MLSARTIYGEIVDDDEAFGLFCSIAASGEAQGGWENGKIAALVPGSQAGLAAKIARHGADEDKHGRIFAALLRKRGLEPVAVPSDADYTMRLEAAGIGLAHARLRREEQLTEADIVTSLAHSRVTEQRASEQMRTLRRHAGDRPDVGRAVAARGHRAAVIGLLLSAILALLIAAVGTRHSHRLPAPGPERTRRGLGTDGRPDPAGQS
jgi:hypothetical protein